MAESISEGTLAAFQRRINDNVCANDEIATVETDKIDVTIESPESGHIVEFLVAEGDTVRVGQKVAIIQAESAQESTPGNDRQACLESPSKEKQCQDTERQQATFEVPHAHSTHHARGEQQYQQSPLVDCRKIGSPACDAYGLSLVGQSHPHASPKAQDRTHEERLVPLSRMRVTIAKRLKESQNRTASLTAVQQVDMAALIGFRQLYKAMVLEQYEVRLGYMGAFTRAATIAAGHVPEVNASMDLDEACITYKDYVDVSIAVSTPKGLVTPVLRGCESKSIVTLEREIANFAKKARDGKITLDDISGGNFTISNPGIFGSLFGTPVINYPQSAVFNMNSIRDEPVIINGQIVVRPMMHITLTYDHRLVDSREAAEFLNIVKNNIEDPGRMLLAST